METEAAAADGDGDGEGPGWYFCYDGSRTIDGRLRVLLLSPFPALFFSLLLSCTDVFFLFPCRWDLLGTGEGAWVGTTGACETHFVWVFLWLWLFVPVRVLFDFAILSYGLLWLWWLPTLP
jgi:hypothetical protein